MTDPDIEDVENESVSFSIPLSAITRYLLPAVLLVLGANYIRETWGSIRWANLQYPYLIIGLMSGLLILVIVEETRTLRAMDPDVKTKTALKAWANQWSVSIGFAVIAIAYVWLLPITGFFSASIAAMASIMYVAGVRNYRVSIPVICGILGLVWLMFVEVIGIIPPSGFIDGLVL